MKNLFTLAAMGLFASAALNANAQFTVDGKASTAEIGTGIGKYQLAGSYSGNHLEADRGVKALYVGYTATTLNIMVVGSAESTTTTPTGGYRSLLVYLNTPARTGTPAGTQLLGGSDTQSSLKHKPTLDMQVDYGFRVSVGPSSGTASDAYFSSVSYVTGTTTTAGTDAYIGQGSKAGAVVTAPATVALPGAKYAYFNTPTLTANTTAINSGLEIEIPLAAFGTTTPVTTGSRLDLFATFTDGDGVFFSETLPQIANRTTTLGTDPNFTTIAGNQSFGFVLGQGVLAAHSAVATALGFSVYPNPAQASSTIAYKVPAGQQPVSLAVYNSMGQLVRTVANGVQAGAHEFSLGRLAAGAYLVKLQVGDQMTSSKVVVN